MKMNVDQNTLPITGGAIAPKAFSFGSGGSAGGPVSIVFSNVVFSQALQVAPVVIASTVETDLATVNVNFNGNKIALMSGRVSIDSAGSIAGWSLRFYVDGVMVSEGIETSQQTAGTHIRITNWSHIIPVTPVGIKPVKIALLNGGPANLTVDLGLVTVMEFLT